MSSIGHRFKTNRTGESGTLVCTSPPILRLDAGFYIHNTDTHRIEGLGEDKGPPPAHVIKGVLKEIGLAPATADCPTGG